MSGVQGVVGMTAAKVKFTHSNKSHLHNNRAVVRDGIEIYRHPEGYFVVLEFQGESGNFREAFWPEDIVKDKLFL